MAWRKLSLPEAYLTLQNEKRRSFFVYPADLPVLKRVDGKLEKEREKGWGPVGRGIVVGLEKPEAREEEVESPMEMEILGAVAF